LISKTNRTRGLVAGAFVVAAIGAPFAISTMTVTEAPAQQAGPACLSWVGNKEDGNCLSYSNGSTTVGTPWYNGGNSPNSGFSTGPMFPGTTINQGIR
jgi:hypothetical protein